MVQPSWQLEQFVCVKGKGLAKEACTVHKALYCELLNAQGAQVWHVFTSDHTALPATHTFIHKWNELGLYLPLLPISRRA